MCGIAGLIRFGSGSERNIERMKERMVHRGPDGEGTWHNADGSVWFGHRRLSIIDLSPAGAQPMTSGSGRMTITYNGEIYNYTEVRDRLLSDGIRFRSTSDTEVLLEAIERYGAKEALSLCKGMFAIGVYDRETGEITLARDRVGEKPLYYGFVNGAFVFASDIGCISVLEGFRNGIRTDVLPIYFTHGYIPAPYTVYEDIWKLEPGKILTIRPPYDKNSIVRDTYWSVTEVAKQGQKNLFRGSFEEASTELERLLRASIRRQILASDVPVGAFLSAGIDSSTVVSLMQAESTQPVRSFTIGMEDPKYNEAVFAGEIARHLGTDHTEMYISEADCKEVIPLLPAMFGEPFADSSQIPTYLVSRMTKQHVTVSLSGDAGDELFCGYNTYYSIERIWSKMKWLWTPLRKTAGTLWKYIPGIPAGKKSYGSILSASSPEDLYRKMMETSGYSMNWRLPLDKSRIPYAYTTMKRDLLGDACHDVMLMDLLMYHPDDILVKVDRTAMAVSLETRVPLLDPDVVEFAWTLPVDYLRTYENGNWTGKRILRDVLYRHVPRELMERPKKGFSIPIMKWLKEPELRAWAEELISDKAIKEQGIFDPAAVKELWNNFIEKDIWQTQIWYLLMFQAWQKQAGRP